MKSIASVFVPVLLAASIALPGAALAEAAWHEGQMVYGANGQRIAPIYRVTADGSVQVILDGKLTTIPAAILSVANGKVVSSKNKADLGR
ncbi:MAG: hypothetical protein KGM17_11090 [Sphingomonadales bacterium]|nr:hypothetical protein [Sphingomonadales bacterium]